VEMTSLKNLKKAVAKANIEPLPKYIIDKHYNRKHGPKAYYGQK